jgi:hypothetical protein
MRTPGPVEPSLRLVDYSDAGRGNSLKAGVSVSVAVRERLGPELYRVAIGRRLVIASSSVLLEPGTLLKARVERAGDALLLRIASKGGRDGISSRDLAPGGAEARAASAFSAAGLPNDAASRVALAALLREGMAPEARALARVRRAALRDAESGGEEADLAAKMEAKGMPSEDAALDEILAFLDGRGGGEKGGGEKGAEPESEGRPPAEMDFRLPEDGDLEKDFRVEVPEGGLPRFLGALIRMMSSRIGGECDSLSLFNQLRGPEGSWIFVPFRFDLDSVDFAGSFRIQLPYVRGGQGRFEAFFSASRGSTSEDWSFFVSFGGGRAPSLRLETSGGAADSRARSRLDALAAELAGHSCSVHMGTRDGDKGVGLSGAGALGFDIDA